LHLAADLARRIGMIRTWPNLQTIRIAIENEADDNSLTLDQAAALIAMAAQELSILSGPGLLPDWRAQAREFKLNRVDRFWFEDGRWKDKEIYGEMLSRLGSAG
jgi:hypothetical protein